MAQLSAWQDYAAHKLYLQQILIPLTVRNNICILPGKTGVLSLTLRLNKTSFTPRHTIIGKGIAYVKPLDPNLPLRPIEIEFENNHCCIEIHNTSDSTVEFLRGQEMAYFDARSKGLVQINNSKHFPIDQYLHDRMTPARLSSSPLAYCYHNRVCLKCNGVLNYKLSLKYYKSSPLLVPWLQHVGKHTPLSLLTP